MSKNLDPRIEDLIAEVKKLREEVSRLTAPQPCYGHHGCCGHHYHSTWYWGVNPVSTYPIYTSNVNTTSVASGVPGTTVWTLGEGASNGDN